MPDINFNCPSCGQNLEAPEDMAGDVLDCPACQKPLTVPKPAFKPLIKSPTPPQKAGTSGSVFSSDAMKKAMAVAEQALSNKCPECNADIKEDAVICMKCGFNKKLGKKMSTDFS